VPRSLRCSSIAHVTSRSVGARKPSVTTASPTTSAAHRLAPPSCRGSTPAPMPPDSANRARPRISRSDPIASNANSSTSVAISLAASRS
jgi:hypothetical protein